jgi:tetratricopeptide (TPR) repeat protein
MRQALATRLALTHALAFSVVLALTPLDGLAQSADALIEQGIAQRRAGDDVAALATLRQAYASSPTPRAAAQLGLVHQALGQWVEAHTRLNEALAAVGDAWIERNRAALQQALGVVQGEVGTVEILIRPLPPEARATLGATDIGPLPMEHPLVVVAGEEELEVSAPGHRTVRRAVRVRAGQLSRVTVELGPETADADADAAIESSADAERAPRSAPSAPEVPTEPAGQPTIPSGQRLEPAERSGGEDWIVWVIAGSVVIVGVGVAVGVLASQQSLEPPLPGTVGAVELLRF